MLLIKKRAWLHYTALMGIGLCAIFGAYLSFQHMILQQLPSELQTDRCLPAINVLAEQYGALATVKLILNGDTNCAIIQWKLLGLSIPQLSLLLFTSILLMSILNQIVAMKLVRRINNFQ